MRLSPTRYTKIDGTAVAVTVTSAVEAKAAVKELKHKKRELKFLRGALAERCGAEGRAMRILYGGSVKPENARELLAIPNVNGALVGGASLKADDFLAIIAACAARAGA